MKPVVIAILRSILPPAAQTTADPAQPGGSRYPRCPKRTHRRPLGRPSGEPDVTAINLIEGNAVVGQSGGPTAVINQSLVGVVEGLRINGAGRPGAPIKSA